MLDRGLLIQAFLNLLRNGAEAMRGEGEITIQVAPSADLLRITVRDTGPGVPAGAEEAIFAPFYTTKARGTGLGLAVSRAAIVAHGGSPGGGACFVVLIPAGADRPASLERASEEEAVGLQDIEEVASGADLRVAAVQ